MSRLKVLLYHEIVPRDSWPTTGVGPVRTAQGMSDPLPEALYVWEDAFHAQMDWLARSGWAVVTPEQVKAAYSGGPPLPDPSVLVTLDDLWTQGMRAAVPVLRSRGWRALAFLVSAWVFDQAQTPATGSPVCVARGEWEAWSDVFALGNHTDRLHTRGPEGPVVAQVFQAEFVADLRRCEPWTTLKGVFAYPFGAVGRGALDGLRSEGFTLAFTTIPGDNTPETSPLNLHRTIVPRDLPLAGFQGLFSS